MTFLSAMLPGLRELRPTIAGGFLWLATAYFALGWAIPTRAEIDADPDSLAFAFVRLQDALGAVGSAGALVFIAFAVGSVTERFGLVDLRPRVVRHRYLRLRVFIFMQRAKGRFASDPAPAKWPEEAQLEYATAIATIEGFALDNRMHPRTGSMSYVLRLLTPGFWPLGRLRPSFNELLEADEPYRPTEVTILGDEITRATAGHRQLRHSRQALELRIATELRDEPLAREVVYRTLAETQLRVAISVPGALLLISLMIRSILELQNNRIGELYVVGSSLLFLFALFAWASAMQDSLGRATHDAGRMIADLTGQEETSTREIGE